MANLRARRGTRCWSGTLGLLLLVMMTVWVLQPVQAHADTLSQAVYISAIEIVAIPSKDGNTAEIVETVALHNGTGRPTAFAVTVPQGATDPGFIAAQSKGWFYGKGAFVNERVPSGNSTLVVSMQAALGGQSADLTFTEPVNVQALFLIVPQGGLFVSAQGGFLTSSDTFVTGNVTYRRFTKFDLQAGVPWSMSLTLLPTAGGRQTPLPPHQPILNAYSSHSVDLEATGNLLLAVAILVVGMISIRRSGAGDGSMGREGRERRARLLARREVVMREWTEFERSHVPLLSPAADAVAYQTGREQYIERALAIDHELQALDPGGE